MSQSKQAIERKISAEYTGAIMGWSLGYDSRWQRDIGYGVPAICDHPQCGEKIDRGLSYVCGGDPYGGEHGCGLYFCANHLVYHLFRGEEICTQVCVRCDKHRKPFNPTSDTLEWLFFKMCHPSWEKWRKEHGLVKDWEDGDCGDVYSLGVETGLGYSEGKQNDTENNAGVGE